MTNEPGTDLVIDPAHLRGVLRSLRRDVSRLATPDFKDRAGYIAWRAEWRDALHAGVDAVRQARGLRADTSRDIPERNEANLIRQGFRGELYDLNEVRTLSKEMARDQYAARKASESSRMPKAA